ncbi:transcriptional regulator (plasmid) [Azospirillum sp. B510]|uniref:LysR family transcriptional regulator n=1 Tax=Azospirillum sp. (strain B510) TaxID=137722 RepID=UPI0001C4B807|nr:LysR family transcriptional regulator [Azospirillum sp. B510]BAI74592.1 transcriptional regulator [Azospirillum sp. B510]
MDRLDDLTVLVEVVDSGSLSAAAERLGLSASAISRRIAQMENRLGTRLLARTTRRIALTDAGATFCLRARAILAALDEAEQSLTETGEEPRGTLRVTMPVMFGQMRVAPLLPSYLRRHPGVSLEVSLSDRVQRLVDEGLDLAIRTGRLADSTLIARRLRPLRRSVVASPDYLERRGVPRSPADLARHDCLTLLSGSGRPEWEFLVGERREVLRPAGGFQADNLWMLRHAAVGGLGLARLADFIVEEDIRAGRLVAVLTDLEVMDEAIHAVYPATRHVSPKVRSFIEHLLAGLNGQDATGPADGPTKGPAATAKTS